MRIIWVKKYSLPQGIFLKLLFFFKYFSEKTFVFISEVFYDFGEDKQDVKKYGKSHPASDGARFMEIGNQVFMQYRRMEDGSFEELEQKNVDFGSGLERVTAASIDSFDIFQISLFH